MLNYTTKIPAHQSIAEISKMLAKAGAKAVMQEYDDDGTVKSLSFSLIFNGNTIGFRLPVNWQAIQSILQRCAEGLSHSLPHPFLRRQVATMSEPAVSIPGGDGLERLTDRFLQCLARPGPRVPKEGLDLGEGLLNRRKIGRVGWKKQHLASFLLDELADSCPLMDAQIIHHHDLADTQTGNEDLLEGGLKGHCIGCPLDDH